MTKFLAKIRPRNFDFLRRERLVSLVGVVVRDADDAMLVIIVSGESKRPHNFLCGVTHTLVHGPSCPHSTWFWAINSSGLPPLQYPPPDQIGIRAILFE